jgi:hypothetical protein
MFNTFEFLTLGQQPSLADSIIENIVACASAVVFSQRKLRNPSYHQRTGSQKCWTQPLNLGFEDVTNWFKMPVELNEIIQ